MRARYILIDIVLLLRRSVELALGTWAKERQSEETPFRCVADRKPPCDISISSRSRVPFVTWSSNLLCHALCRESFVPNCNTFSQFRVYSNAKLLYYVLIISVQWCHTDEFKSWRLRRIIVCTVRSLVMVRETIAKHLLVKISHFFFFFRELRDEIKGHWEKERCSIFDGRQQEKKKGRKAHRSNAAEPCVIV